MRRGYKLHFQLSTLQSHDIIIVILLLELKNTQKLATCFVKNGATFFFVWKKKSQLPRDFLIVFFFSLGNTRFFVSLGENQNLYWVGFNFSIAIDTT